MFVDDVYILQLCQDYLLICNYDEGALGDKDLK